MITHRRLGHNQSTAIPRRLICVDTETRVRGTEGQGFGEHELWFGCARHCRIDGDGDQIDLIERSSRTFFNKTEFWDFVNLYASEHETTWVCAHNLGFDATILGTWELLNEGKLAIKTPGSVRGNDAENNGLGGILLLEDPPTMIGVETSEGARLLLIDTLNYWRSSLKTLAKGVGLEKLDMPKEITAIADWITYCQRDCEIVESAMVNLIRWWSRRQYGKFRWTSPGLAWSAFRHSFYTHSIDFHDSVEVRALERSSYFGGQLEIYYLGEIKQHVYQVDVNSLYPSVMLPNEYPVRLMDTSQGPIWQGKELPHRPQNCIAEVRLCGTQETFPLRINNEVWYARGPMITTLAGPELQYAFDCGYVVDVGRWAFYLCRPIFTTFVQHFFSEKQHAEDSGDLVTRTFAKLLLNSLYGKFGQRGGHWTLNDKRLPVGKCGIFYESNLITKESVKCLAIGNIVLDWCPNQEITQSFPAISSFVTSCARQSMRRLRKTAGSGNYVYMSTDSLIVNDKGYRRLVANGEVAERELGKLKLEQEAESATIRGLHWYSMGDKHVEGSVKSSAEWVDDTTWREPQFERLSTIVGRGGGASVNITQIEKHRNLIYRKGYVRPDGWVEPYTGDDIARLVDGSCPTSEVRESADCF